MMFWIILLLLSSNIGVITQAQPYIVITTTRKGPRENTFFLQCQNDGGGSFVSNAAFYRNGALSSKDDCLKNYASIFSNGSIHLHVIPSCEGYYQCGHNNILSKPVKVYAYPQLLPNTSRATITLHAREGDDVELPCPMDVSYFNQLNILWTRNVLGQIIPIPKPVNEDYSVTLSNVTVLSSGVYFCTARSKILSGGSSSLTGPQVNLVVQKKHESPQFLTDITHIQDTNDNHIFRINARGTQPLSFKWYLNTKCLNGSVQREISSQDGHTVKIRSEIKLPSLPSKTSQLSVIVSNKDDTKGQFVTSKTGFLLRYENTPTMSPPPCRNDSHSFASVATEPAKIGEIDLIIFIAVLGALSLFLLLIVMILSCVVCYLRHNNKMCTKCKHKLLPLDSQSSNSSNNSTPQPQPPTITILPPNIARENSVVPTYVPSKPYPHPQMIPGHPFSSTNCTIIPSPLPPAPGQCPNPISSILLNIGYLYWNAEVSDTTLLSSLQQILIRVLDEPMVISNYDARTYVKNLRNEIMNFADELREQRCRGGFSRQTTISGRNCNSENSICSLEPVDTAERTNEMPLEDLEIEETDGGAVQGVENAECEIKAMTNIVCVLTRWISVHDEVDEADHLEN